MNDYTLNTLLQWAAIIAIMIIVTIAIVRKIIRFRNQLKQGENMGCGCSSSCSNCSGYTDNKPAYGRKCHSKSECQCHGTTPTSNSGHDL